MARKLIKKVAVTLLDTIVGAIFDTTNIDDKTANTYSARVIDELVDNIEEQVNNIEVPTKTSELENDSGFITSADVTSGLTISSIVPTTHTCFSSTTIQSSSSKSGTVTFTKSGYYPIGLGGFTPVGTISSLYISAASSGSVSVYYKMTNPDAGASAILSLSCVILWAK